MAKDTADKLTLDLLGQKKRGRPSTGKALTPSQRQARYRQNNVSVTLSTSEWGSIVFMLRHALKDKIPTLKCEAHYQVAQKFYKACPKYRDTPVPEEFLFNRNRDDIC